MRCRRTVPIRSAGGCDRTSAMKLEMTWEILRSIAENGRPVAVGLLDMTGNIGFPLLLDILVIVQVKLAADDLPYFRIGRCGLVLRHGPSTVTAILRRVFLRTGDEEIAVLRGSETPFHVHPPGGKFFPALDGLAVGEIGDRIVAAYRDAAEKSCIDRRFLGQRR